MSVVILDKKTYESVDKEETKCHLLPCEIHYDGEAKVSEYFESSVRTKDTPEGSFLTASFRGRPLLGEEIKVPEGYTGIVFKEAKTAYTDEDDRNLMLTHKFKELTCWNLDMEPSEDDKIKQALQWIDVAKVLHRPLDTDSSQKSVVGN